MPVQEQTPYIEHIANGVTTSFSLEFECKDKEHLIVLVDNAEPNVGTWSLVNGAVVFGIAPENGKIITIQRNTPFRRDTNFQSYDNSLRPATINKDFDWIWYKLQELGVADWILGSRIDALKNYVDDRDDELRAYLMEEIRKQGVALDQLDDYYNYLMQRLAQIAIDRGWAASFIVSADGSTQQEINDFGGAKWRNKPLGYDIGSTVKLDNGDIVKSTINGNTKDPNVDMTGWLSVGNTGEVESIADLLAISNPKNSNRMFVNGLQGGWFTYDSDAISLTDNILFFNGWKRELDVVALRPEWAGAARDGLTDDSAAFQITYNATAKYGFSVKHTDGTYAVKSPITIDGSVNQFKFIVLKGTFRGNGINAKFFPSTNNGTTIKTFGNAFLEVKFLKYWNEAVSVQGIAVVDSVGNGDFAFRMTKGGFPNNIADFRYNTGFIFEDVATVGFKDDIVFRGNYRKDQGGIYNNNYFGQVTLNRVYTYEGTSSIVLENATLNRFSAYDTMFFTMSSGAVVKRPNPLIPADQNTEMHFIGQFNMCHFEDCRGMFRFDDTPATNERNFVTLIDTTREFCGLFDQNNGNPLGVFKHTDLTLIGRFDQKGYGETTIPELEVGSSVTTDRKLDVKLTNAKSLSPNFINVFSSEIAVLNGETVTKNVFCADGAGKQFQLTTELIVSGGQGGISKIDSVGLTGSTGHHSVVNKLSPNITVTCNSAANNMQQISVTNNSGATIYVWINVIKNVTGVQCYLT